MMVMVDIYSVKNYFKKTFYKISHLQSLLGEENLCT